MNINYFNHLFFGCLAIFVFATEVLAQLSPPESISYQGIARDASGDILSNQSIGIQFIIHQGSAGGTSVFTEQHSVTTNSLGLFTLQIGSVNTFAFSSINWANGPYYLEVQMDPNGGTSYTSVGTQQMLSVPYALYAKNSYSANYALASYTTANAPPVSITTNTSLTDATITVSQGTNSSSATINFPPAPTPTITITGSGITAVAPTTGNVFTINTPSPSLSINTDTNTGVSTLSLTQGTATSTINIPPSSVSIVGTGITTVLPTGPSTIFTINTPSPSLLINTNPTTGASTITLTQGSAISTETLSSPTNYAWGLTGNAGTNPSTNFLGTTDNNGLIFKTNNTERMRLSSGGGVSIGTTTLCSGCLLDVAGKIGVNVNTSYGLISRSGLSGGTYTVPGNAGVMGMFDYSSGIGAGIAGVTTNSAFAGSYAVYGNAALPSHFSAYFLGGKNYFQKEVGIGTTSPLNPLHIVSSNSVHAARINYTNTASSSDNAAIFASATSISSAGIVAGRFEVSGSSSTNNAHALLATAISTATYNTGIEASATGTVNYGGLGTNYGGRFIAQNAVDNYGINSIATGTTTGTNYGGYFSASNANTNYGIEASAVGTTTNSNYGGYFSAQDAAYNYGGYFYTTNGTNNNTAIFAYANGSVSSANNYGINSFATGTANTNYGGYFSASNGSTNYAVYATINATDAISSAIYAATTGTNGSAGYFQNSTTNNSDVLKTISFTNGKALYAESNGTGDVIYANAASSSTKNALTLQNGHISTISSGTPNVSLGMGCSSWVTCAPPTIKGNDVNGTVYDTLTASVSLTGGSSLKSIKVTFTKPYNFTPKAVVVGPYFVGSYSGSVPQFTAVVTDITSIDFTVRLSIANSTTINSGGKLGFTYIVIE